MLFINAGPPSVMNVNPDFDGENFSVGWDLSRTSARNSTIFYLEVLGTNFSDTTSMNHYTFLASECSIDPCTGCSISITASNSFGVGDPVVVMLRSPSVEGAYII
jgi:hypothetical protein